MSTLKSSAENLTLNADGANNDIILQSNGSTKVTIDGQNSRVGIGTTAPQNLLHLQSADSANDNYRTGADTPLIVEGTTASYIQFVGDTNAPMGMLMADTSDTAKGAVYYDHDGGGMTIKSGGATRFQVGTGGDVTTSNSLTLTEGDIVFGTAGKGICLGVTTNTDANTIDDYEEGSFTPTLNNTGGSPSYTWQIGHYIKIGQWVWIDANVKFTVTPSGVTTQAIGGLPFTSRSGAGQYHGMHILPQQGFNYDGDGIMITVGDGSTIGYVGEYTAGVGGNESSFLANEIGTTIEYRLTGHYVAA